MSELSIIVPSHNRPEAVAELLHAFSDTCTADTELVFAVDKTDSTLSEYTGATVIATDSSTMVEALNEAALTRLDSTAVGFMGDDHRPRTKGWDSAYLDVLAKPGIVYGDDLFQGQNLPTQVAISSSIIKALGFMAPSVLRHMYVDNYWRDLGTALNCLHYLPHIVVEHLHPSVGKATWSEDYRRVDAFLRPDEVAYRNYLSAGQMEVDVERVEAILR